MFRVAKAVAATGILMVVWGLVALVLDAVVDVSRSIPSFSLVWKACSLLGILLWVVGSYLMARYVGVRELFVDALYVVGGSYAAQVLLYFTSISLAALMMDTGRFSPRIAASVAAGYVAWWVTLVFMAKFYREYAAILERRFNSKTAKKSSKLMWRGSLLALAGIGVLLILFAWLLTAIAIIEAREPLLRQPKPKIEELGEET